jgi:vesicular inhibitory amino acid transporter
VNSIQIIEQVLTCSSHFLLCGSLLHGCFPKWPIGQTTWCILCCASLVPVVFLQRLTTLSKVSFWSTVALFPIAISILFHCLLNISTWDWSQLRPKWDPMFPATFGVLAINYTSQVFLPMLETNLIDRSKYKPMVKWTHASAIISKLVFCLLTVFTYGDRTRSIITNNLPKPIFRITVNVFIVFKVLLTYPLYYFSAIDLIETTFFQQKPETIFPSCYTDDFPRALHPWAIGARLGLVGATLVLALFIPFYTLLLGIIGSFTGFMLVAIFPCSFHLQLKWNELEQREKALDIFIIVISIICIFFGVFSSAYELNEVATKGAKEVFERV